MANIQKQKAIDLADELVNYLQDRSVSLAVEQKTASLLETSCRTTDKMEIKREADFIVIFGGDGTMLEAAGEFCDSNTPLLGINVGSLGFMAVIEAESMFEAADELLAGNYTTDARMMISARVIREGEKIFESHGLNDAVISRGNNRHLIDMDFYIGEQFIANYRGDGLIAATPTGSTAYSLSAGGPIINPELEVISLTPICPHNLYIRPMIIGGDEQVQIEPKIKSGQLRICTDGRCDFSFKNGDKVILTKSSRSVKMVQFPERNFYRILREKLKLGIY